MTFLKITALTGAACLVAFLGYKYVTADPPDYCSVQGRYIPDDEFLKASIALYEWDMNREIKVYPDGVIKRRRDYGASYGYWERTRHRSDCCDIVRPTDKPLGRMLGNRRVEVRLYTGASRGDSQARFYFNVCGALIPSDDSFLGSGVGGFTTTEIINSKTGAKHGL